MQGVSYKFKTQDKNTGGDLKVLHELTIFIL